MTRLTNAKDCANAIGTVAGLPLAEAFVIGIEARTESGISIGIDHGIWIGTAKVESGIGTAIGCASVIGI